MFSETYLENPRLRTGNYARSLIPPGGPRSSRTLASAGSTTLFSRLVRRRSWPSYRQGSRTHGNLRTKSNIPGPPAGVGGSNCIVVVRGPAGYLDSEAIVRDMGETWAAKYRKEPSLRVTLRPKGIPTKLRAGSIWVNRHFFETLGLAHCSRQARTMD